MRILILSGNTGEGHNSAAKALKEGFEAKGCECQIQDGLIFMSRQTSELICKSHVFLYRNLPKIYGIGYRFEEKQAQKQSYQEKLNTKVARLHRRTRPHKGPDLKLFLEKGRYDAVICVHVFAAKLMSELRRSGQISVPTFFLATDYTCSPGVNQLDMDAWLIPHRQLIPEFAGYGIPESKLIPTGIPVRAEFSHRRDKAHVRRELNLPADRRIVVLSCGSMGAGPMGRLVLTLVETMPKDSLLIAICGSNHVLERNLRSLIRSKKLLVKGFVERMSDYMDAADIYLTKPGGLSTTEALFKRVPLVLINAVPGCETRNMEFLTAIGCAASASGTMALARLVSGTLKSGASLEYLTRRCAGEFVVNGTDVICDYVLQHLPPLPRTAAFADAGLIGLSPKGQNLALNFEARGYRLAVYDRNPKTAADFLRGEADGKSIEAASGLSALMQSLKPPRKLMLLAQNHPNVDEWMDQLLPLMEPGDLLMDFSESHYNDTERRCARADQAGILFLGCGISGSAEGMRFGPSIMAGGSPAAWEMAQAPLNAISAQVNGQPCCAYLGSGGAGHFALMALGGIEYSLIQLAREIYALLHELLKLSVADCAETFARWNQTPLNGFLTEAAAELLQKSTSEGIEPVCLIPDLSERTGTGRWNIDEALNEGIPMTAAVEALFARQLSARESDRRLAASAYPRVSSGISGDTAELIEIFRRAFEATQTVIFAQSFQLICSAPAAHGWSFHAAQVARIWRGGSIVRCAFLDKILDAYARNPQISNLLLDSRIAQDMRALIPAWRKTADEAVQAGISVPVLTAALSWFDGETRS